MREIFADILRQTQNNQTAEWQMEIDSETYTRLFRPKERLILFFAVRPQSGGRLTHHPPVSPESRLILLGAGSQLWRSMLGFSVTVVDDRPSFANHPRFPQAEQIVCDAFPHAIEHLHIHAGDYVAVITRGHRYDADCLRTLLAEPCRGIWACSGPSGARLHCCTCWRRKALHRTSWTASIRR